MLTLEHIEDLERSPTAAKLLTSWPLVQVLEDHVARLIRQPEPWTSTFQWGAHRQKGAFHPSEYSNPCDAFLAFQLVGEKEERKERVEQRRIFDTGTVIHELLQYYMGTWARLEGHDYHAEVRVRHDALEMTGHADGLLAAVVAIGGQQLRFRMVLDYKSCNSTTFNKLGNTPGSSYVKQLHGYLKALDVPMGCILYFNKDNSNMRALYVPFDYGVWTPIQQRLERIQAQMDQYQIPPRRIGRSCHWCRYNAVCQPRKLAGKEDS